MLKNFLPILGFFVSASCLGPSILPGTPAFCFPWHFFIPILFFLSLRKNTGEEGKKKAAEGVGEAKLKGVSL